MSQGTKANKPELFAVRKFSASTHYGARSYHDERIFSSWQDATRYAKSLLKGEFPEFVGELTRFRLKGKSFEETKDRWYVYRDDRSKRVVLKQDIPTSCSAETKYRLGDIVFVRAFPWNADSFLWLDVLGVISWVPEKPGRPSDGDEAGLYRIEYVDPKGYLEHEHFCSNALRRFTGRIPRASHFIRKLANHYKGTELIEDGILGRLRNRRERCA